MAEYQEEHTEEVSENISEDIAEVCADSEENTSEDEIAFSEDIEEESIPEDPKKKKRKKKLITLGIIGGVILVLIISGVISGMVKKRAAQKDMYTDVQVERRTIKKTITGSSATEPNDSYNVMTMKSGDITADFFKEGDTVKKGDKLYQFDDDDATTSLSTAKNALAKAEQAYVDAVKQKTQTVSSNDITTKSLQNAIARSANSLTDSQNSYNDQYLRSDVTGKVTAVSVKAGQTITVGTPIATVYNDSVMKIRLPFNDFDAESVTVGSPAQVTVTGSGDTIMGTVTEKSTASTASDAHTMVVYVTIDVTNPGALTEKDRGSAVVGGAACADSANFEYKTTQNITAKTSGTLKSLTISEGDSVRSGQQIGYVESTTADTALSNAKLGYDDAVLNLEKQVLASDTYAQDSAIKNAQISLDDARINLKKAQDSVEDYVVEAPIEGTVVKKNAKEGDTRDASNSTEALCVIYDLSSLKIKLDVDETEITQVKPGLKANITADAVEGEFEGYVTKVPVDGVNENGVTTYTIEIQLDNYGALLPGMNVDAEIVVEEALNVLSVPVNSVNRGDVVFVKDDGRSHENDVTNLMNNSDKDKKSKKDKDKKETPAPDKKGNDTLPVVSAPSESPVKSPDNSSIPSNLEVPKGYVALQVITGLNDTDYIEIKSGLTEEDMVRTLNTESSSAGVSFGEDDMMAQMEQEHQQQMRQMQSGGGMGVGPGGGSGMGGGPR